MNSKMVDRPSVVVKHEMDRPSVAVNSKMVDRPSVAVNYNMVDRPSVVVKHEMDRPSVAVDSKMVANVTANYDEVYSITATITVRCAGGLVVMRRVRGSIPRSPEYI